MSVYTSILACVAGVKRGGKWKGRGEEKEGELERGKGNFLRLNLVSITERTRVVKLFIYLRVSLDWR